MGLPTDEIMRQMAKLAMEQAAEFFARQAEDFAKHMPKDASAADALTAFAAAIRSTSTNLYPPSGVKS